MCIVTPHWHLFSFPDPIKIWEWELRNSLELDSQIKQLSPHCDHIGLDKAGVFKSSSLFKAEDLLLSTKPL